MMTSVVKSAWACKFPEGSEEVEDWGPGLLTTQNSFFLLLRKAKAGNGLLWSDKEKGKLQIKQCLALTFLRMKRAATYLH